MRKRADAVTSPKVAVGMWDTGGCTRQWANGSHNQQLLGPALVCLKEGGRLLGCYITEVRWSRLSRSAATDVVYGGRLSHAKLTEVVANCMTFCPRAPNRRSHFGVRTRQQPLPLSHFPVRYFVPHREWFVPVSRGRALTCAILFVSGPVLGRYNRHAEEIRRETENLRHIWQEKQTGECGVSCRNLGRALFGNGVL